MQSNVTKIALLVVFVIGLVVVFLKNKKEPIEEPDDTIVKNLPCYQDKKNCLNPTNCISCTDKFVFNNCEFSIVRIGNNFKIHGSCDQWDSSDTYKLLLTYGIIEPTFESAATVGNADGKFLVEITANLK